MVLDVMQNAGVWMDSLSLVGETARSLMAAVPLDSLSFDQLSLDHLVLAQQVPQTDLVGDIQRAFDNFVKTGQAWAFIIGLVFVYMIKTFTTFG